MTFAVLDPKSPPRQGQLAGLAVEAAGRGTELVLLVCGRAASLLGVDPVFEARLAARKLDLPVGVVDPDVPYLTPGVLSTDLEDRFLAALVSLCPKRRTSELVEAASQAKRGGLFGLRGRGREEAGGQSRPVILLGAALSPGSVAGLVAELDRTGVEVSGVVPDVGGAGLPPSERGRSWECSIRTWRRRRVPRGSAGPGSSGHCYPSGWTERPGSYRTWRRRPGPGRARWSGRVQCGRISGHCATA